MKLVFAASLAALALTLGACGDADVAQGSAEQAGERADTQFEQATQGSTDLSDGPLENAGEAIDDARENAGEAASSAAGAADRATDGNPTTQP